MSSLLSKLYNAEEKVLLDDYGNLLSAYFDNDGKKRFKFEKLLGGGAFGLTWLLKYNPAGGPPLEKKIVFKMGFEAALVEKDYVEGPSYAAQLDSDTEREIKIMRKLKFARHIARLIEIDDDPLRVPFPLRPHRNGHSCYMEYIPNGTLQDFLYKCRDSNDIPHLPNRILWRIFLCLTRACIGLQWPPDDPGDGSQVPERRRTDRGSEAKILHNDIHNGNIMIDDFTPNEEEHDLFPALKLIDFGKAREYPLRESSVVEAMNVWEIGLVMMSAITTDQSWIHRKQQDPVLRTTLTPGGPAFETIATDLHPDPDDMIESDPVPWLDNDLKALVSGCLARSPRNRPSLMNLVTGGVYAYRTYDSTHYMNKASGEWMLEGDNAIRDFARQMLLHPPPE